jgi:hypothetical protein
MARRGLSAMGDGMVPSGVAYSDDLPPVRLGW